MWLAYSVWRHDSAGYGANKWAFKTYVIFNLLKKIIDWFLVTFVIVTFVFTGRSIVLDKKKIFEEDPIEITFGTINSYKKHISFRLYILNHLCLLAFKQQLYIITLKIDDNFNNNK